MLRSLYDWTLRLAAHRHALWAMAFIAFLESSIFPIPVDALLIPMILAARDRAWLIAGVCTLASVLGGVAGYGIGYFLYDTLGRWIVDLYDAQAAFDAFRSSYAEWGLWAVFIGGITPLPYKIVTIASGVLQFDLFTFTLSSVAARGIRFFAVAALLWYFGPPIRAFIERRLGVLALLFFVLLIGGFIALRYLV